MVMEVILIAILNHQLFVLMPNYSMDIIKYLLNFTTLSYFEFEKFISRVQYYETN